MIPLENQITPWINEIPKKWKKDRLGNVADIIFSNVDKHSFDDEIPVRLCNYVDVYKNNKITSQIDFMEATAEQGEIDRFQLNNGDVLATKDSESYSDIAIPALVEEELPGVICGYHLALIRSYKHKMIGSFTNWLHSSKAFRIQYEAKALGVTRFGLSQHSFKEALVPVPPINEQQIISEYLDVRCTEIDEAVLIKKRQLDTLYELRKSIIQKAVTKGLNSKALLTNSYSDGIGKIPSHWKIDRMKDVIELRNEKTDIVSEENDYLELEDLESGTGRILNRRNTLEVESAVTLFKKGDVLFGKLRPYLEKFYHSDFDGKCTGEILAFKPTRITSRYLFYCIASPWFIAECNAISYGVKMPRVNWNKQLASFYLPLPPINEQQAICEYLDSKLEVIHEIINSIKNQIITLSAYRNALIHECIIGKRQISDMLKILNKTNG